MADIGAIPTAPPAEIAPEVMLPPPQHESSPSSNAIPDRVMQALFDQGYTRGLAEALARNKQMFPLRIWIVDNSGSMSFKDGHRIVTSASSKRSLKFVTCTRWAEMQQTVDYHAQLTALLEARTVFRMLNDPGRVCGPQQFGIAERGREFLDQDLATATSTIMNAQPGGVTPLTQHLKEIRASIMAMDPTLRQNGGKVAVVIATDGVPSNDFGGSDDVVKREFMDAMKSLEGLPIWIVVRLCTDDESIVDFWENLDNNLEMNLDVLDDFLSEAAEVHKVNPWLNYGLPLHRMRELGFYHRLFDLLDERRFTKDEVREFCVLLFGRSSMDGVPDPEADWKIFVERISRLNDGEQKQWNPTSKKMEKWIDLSQLKNHYGDSTCVLL